MLTPLGFGPGAGLRKRQGVLGAEKEAVTQSSPAPGHGFRPLLYREAIVSTTRGQVEWCRDLRGPGGAR